MMTEDTKVLKIIEQHIWKIWGYVRENRESLDSERACKKIRATIELAIEAVAKLLAAEKLESKRLRDKNRDLRERIKELEANSVAPATDCDERTPATPGQ